MGHIFKKSKKNGSRTEDKTTFFYYAFRNVLLVSVPLVVVSGLALSHLSLHSSAEGNTNSIDSINLTLHTSCTISATEVTPHTAVLEGSGLHRENIGTTKVGVFCNDNNGYNIYAIGHSNNIDGNTDLVGSGLSSNYSINTGVYSSGDTVSSWGMKLTAGTGTGAGGETVTPPNIVNGYNDYSTVPNVYTLVASRPSGTNMNKDADVDVTGSYFTTTYDIYASSIQPAGTYNGKVKYILTHPNTNAPNTINDIDAAFAMNDKQKVYQDANGSYYAMQDMTHEICSSVTRSGVETTTQLVDNRDNKLYYVTKLADGNCWMTQNLDLDIGGANTSTLTSNNTDLSTTASGSGIYANGYTVDSNNVWTWTPVSTAITSNTTITYPNNTNNPTVSPAWPQNTTGHTTPYSAEGGDTYYYTSNTADNDTRYTSLQACKDASHTEDECKRYATGNYYNWSAAIASNNSANIGSTVGDIASNSICPKGWRLPNASQTDNVNNEFGRMLFKEGITASLSNGNESVGYYNGVTSFNKLRSNPYYFVRSGNINGSTLYNSGVYGRYWSSTVSGSTNAYDLDFNGTDIYPARNTSRYVGRSVRCVAR